MADMSFQGSGEGVGLRALSMCMGLFLIRMGMQKFGWLVDSGFLVQELEGWRLILAGVLEPDPGSGFLAGLLETWRGLTFGNSLRYLDAVAIPYASIFARIIPLAEFFAGAVLMVGFSVRLTAGLVLAMVLNFHFASGILFTWGYLTNGYGPPVVGGLLALTIGGRALPFSLR